LTTDASDTNDDDRTDTNDSDVVMTNGKESSNGTIRQSTTQPPPETSSNEETMDVDPPPRLSVVSNPARLEFIYI
jgi:hypothetical protein